MHHSQSAKSHRCATDTRLPHNCRTCCCNNCMLAERSLPVPDEVLPADPMALASAAEAAACYSPLVKPLPPHLLHRDMPEPLQTLQVCGSHTLPTKLRFGLLEGRSRACKQAHLQEFPFAQLESAVTIPPCDLSLSSRSIWRLLCPCIAHRSAVRPALAQAECQLAPSLQLAVGQPSSPSDQSRLQLRLLPRLCCPPRLPGEVQ